MTTRLLLVAALCAAFAVSADAQRPRQIAPRANARVPVAQDSVNRAQLEGAVRLGFGRAVRQRVGLSDAQIARLVPLSRDYEQRRRGLQVEERETRLSLREALRNESTADQTRVDQLLQRLLVVQKRRVELLEAEYRDLATIMTPIQRAKYLALQEQIRRRLDQLRQQQPANGGRPPGTGARQRPLR